MSLATRDDCIKAMLYHDFEVAKQRSQLQPWSVGRWRSLAPQFCLRVATHTHTIYAHTKNKIIHFLFLLWNLKVIHSYYDYLPVFFFHVPTVIMYIWQVSLKRYWYLENIWMKQTRWLWNLFMHFSARLQRTKRSLRFPFYFHAEEDCKTPIRLSTM